jgi:pimeloyl-ACP methyl ester carboxylesterase
MSHRAIVLMLFFLLSASCRSVVLPGPVRVKGVGAACAAEVECRRGMTCASGACTPAANIPAGSLCDLTAGCEGGLYCNEKKLCATAGNGPLNTSCASSGDCERGLVCAASGLFPICQAPGNGDVGAACTTATECLAGLGCSSDGKCAAGEKTLSPTVFAGVQCQPDTGETFRSYFEVPEEGQSGSDFFRMPFPNEARNRGTRYDLKGFPSPPAGAFADMLASYVTRAELENGGAGTNQSITLRFNQGIKGSDKAQPNAELSYGTSSANLLFYKVEPVDPGAITPPSDDFDCVTDAFDGSNVPKWKFTTVPGVVVWQFSTEQKKYTCANTLVFRPRTDNPLDPNALYALVLTTDVRSVSDQPLTPDADLAKLLDSVAPSETRLQKSYGCYGPLRAALRKSSQDGRAISVGQAVLIKTQDATAAVKAVARTMSVLPVEQQPEVRELVKCAAGVSSPCGGEASRECPSESNAAYDEYHGQLRVPVLQAGERPYVTSGGDITYTDGTKTRAAPKSGDRALVQGTEDVCFSLTVPKTGFDTGRALAIYGHGTGGHFRSFVTEELADRLAAASPKLAVLSFDQPLHGSRRGGSDQDPALLYFNVGNPRAMRDNGLQAVADYAQFVAFSRGLSSGSATFAATVDMAVANELNSKLQNHSRVFIGHSQGGTNGALYLATAPNTDVGSAVLSGVGGSLIQALISKKKPFDFPTLMAQALGENELSEYHPVLNLLQSVAERSDPINVARAMIGINTPARSLQALPVTPASGAQPNPTIAAKSLLHVIGLNDSYTPLRASSDFWRVLGTVPAYAANSDVEPSGASLDGFETGSGKRTERLKLISQATDTGAADGLSCNCLPIATAFATMPRAEDGTCSVQTSADATTRARRTTAATVVYEPSGDTDGHFVLFQNDAAQAHLKTFLETAVQSNNGFCAAISPRIPPN